MGIEKIMHMQEELIKGYKKQIVSLFRISAARGYFLHGYGLALFKVAAVYNHCAAHELANGEGVQRCTPGKKVRRRVNMRSGMGIHAEQRFLKAVLFV